jgi:hypothetical protein
MAAAFRNEESCLLLFYAVIRSLKFNKLTMPTPSEAQPDSALLHTTQYTAEKEHARRSFLLSVCYDGP